MHILCRLNSFVFPVVAKWKERLMAKNKEQRDVALVYKRKWRVVSGDTSMFLCVCVSIPASG